MVERERISATFGRIQSNISLAERLFEKVNVRVNCTSALENIMRSQIVGVWISLAVICRCVQGADTFPWETDAFSSLPQAMLAAAAELTPPENATVDILLDETKFEFDTSRRVRKTQRRVYRLLTKEALDEWSVVTAAWSPWHEERPQIQVRVISTDGLSHLLDAKAISEAPVEQSGQIFRDRRRLVAPLPAVEVGAVVESQIVIAEHRAFCDEGIFEEHFFHSSEPIRSMRLIVESPDSGAPLHHRVRGIELTTKRSVTNGLLRLEFGPVSIGTSNRIEGYLPAEMPLLPHVVIGNGTAWTNVAQHYAKIVDRQIGDASFVDIAREIVGDEQSRLVVIQKLLEGVQKRVRYVGIEFGESSIVPHSPQETLKLRYGDCKDQSTLLVALLRALGHTAHVALLRAGRHEELLADFPALNAFDHAIVYVPGSPPIWIDPTAPFFSVGELPPTDLGRLALIAAPTTNDLIRTPEPKSANNSVIRTREYVLASGDRGRLRETFESHGAYENRIRSYYAERKADELRSDLASRLKERFGADRVTEFKYGDPFDLTVPFHVHYEADGINYGLNRPTCNVALAPERILDDIPWPLRQYDQDRKPNAGADNNNDGGWKRKSPFQFPEPFSSELRYRVALPPGFIAPKLPDAFSKQFGPVTVLASFAKESEQLIVATFRFDTGSGRLSADEANALRAFLGQLRGGSNEAWLVNIDLEHAASQHIAKGRIREGIAEYQRLVAQQPADMELRTWYVESLITAGLGAAAREEARRATELNAKSSRAWATLGYARMYDDFGQFMRDGSDPLKAEAALRKALKIDPKLQSTRWNLAITLEYGSGLRRYAPGSRLKEAAEQYRILRAQEYSEPQLTTNLLWTLAYLEQWSEVVSLAEELEPSLMRDAMWVAAVSVVSNVAAGNAKARELAESDDARRELLLNASDVLNNVRRYAASTEIAECALNLVADPERRKRIQRFAAAIKDTKRIEEVLFPKKDPRRVVQQLHAAALAGRQPKSVSSLFVQEASTADVRLELEKIRERYAATIRTALNNNKSSERLADMASLLELKSDGDSDVGFRVCSANVCWYVTKQDGKLRLLPTGADLTVLGREALRRLDAGDEAEARRWLEWAAAQLPPPAGFFPDPFSASPFGSLWYSLKRDHLKIAAIVLAAPKSKTDDTVQVLSEFRQTITSKSQLLQVDRALAATFANRNDWEQLLQVAERLQTSFKSAEEPRQWKLLALLNLDRMNEFREVKAQSWSKLTGAARTWAEGFSAAKLGDFELSNKLLRPLADDPSGMADPMVFNELAWNALFSDEEPTDAVLQDAVKANVATEYRTPAFLHTLATVYAELGRPVEARKYLLQVIDARGGKMENVDLYVLGRISECYGFKEIAAEYYARVESSKEANSTYNLAQRRLKQHSEP